MDQRCNTTSLRVSARFTLTKHRTTISHGNTRASEIEMAVLHVFVLDEHVPANNLEKRGWTQSEAAKKLGITQPRISALMKGAWRGFSADMLLVLAARLGLRPTLKLAA